MGLKSYSHAKLHYTSTAVIHKCWKNTHATKHPVNLFQKHLDFSKYKMHHAGRQKQETELKTTRPIFVSY